MFYDCFLEKCASVLHRNAVEANPQDLQDDRFNLHKNFNLVVGAAVLVYFSKHLSKDVCGNGFRAVLIYTDFF